MKKTGKLLKDAREKKNLSLHEIGMSLKINPKTLQAMEEGEMSKLPAKSFLRGFVKSYALYLKLDANEVLSVFQSEIDPTPASTLSNSQPAATQGSSTQNINTTTPTEPPAIVESKPPASDTSAAPAAAAKTAQSISIKSMPSANQSNDSFFTNKFLLSAGGAVLVILIVFTAKLVEKYQKERVVDHTQVQQIQSENQTQESLTATLSKTDDEKLLDLPTTDSAKIVETKSEQNKTNPTQLTENIFSTNVPTNVAPAKSTIAEKVEAKIEQQKPVKEEKKVEAAIDAKAELKKVEPKQESAPTGKPTEVIVEALNNVMIKYSLGDGKINTLELSPEQLHTFKSKTVVELDISDGGSVSLIVNGREKGVPGSAGKPLKLVYPKQ